MRSSLSSILIFSLAFCVGITTSAAFYFASRTESYRQSARETNMNRFERTVRIISVDSEKKTMRISIVGSAFLGSNELTVQIRSLNRYFVQKPAIEDGILVRMLPAQPARMSDLAPGRTARAILLIDSSGTIKIDSLLLDDPFVI